MLISMPLIAFFGWFIPFTGGFTWTFIICAFISLLGTIMIWMAFKNPIPKTDELVLSTEKEKDEVQEMDIT